MAFMNRDTRMLRTEVLAMVGAVDPIAAQVLDASVWDGPRWHPESGRMVLRLTAPSRAAADLVLRSAEAVAALSGRLGSACWGAPWTVAWAAALDEARPLQAAGVDTVAGSVAEFLDRHEPLDAGALELLRTADDHWTRLDGAPPAQVDDDQGACTDGGR